MASNKKRSAPAGAAGTPVQNGANKAASTTRASFSQEFNPDYSHVIRDLKQIAIMAVSFLVILVVLSFFLR